MTPDKSLDILQNYVNKLKAMNEEEAAAERARFEQYAKDFMAEGKENKDFEVDFPWRLIKKNMLPIKRCKTPGFNRGRMSNKRAKNRCYDSRNF